MKQARHIYEEHLVQEAQSGQHKALSGLAELRGPRLLAHATRLLGDREAARDVVQEAWIEILRGLPGLREPAAFPAWATRIVTRRAARFIHGRVQDRQAMAVMANDTEGIAKEAGPDAADANNVRKAIAALPSEQSTTIALFYLEDMSVAEVAVALDIPPGTVKTRLMHARAKLKDALKGESDDKT